MQPSSQVFLLIQPIVTFTNLMFQALLRKYNNYIKDLEKKLKEKEHQKKPEAIEEMQRLLQEKDLKINELKQQLVVSSASQSAVARNNDSLSVCAVTKYPETIFIHFSFRITRQSSDPCVG